MRSSSASIGAVKSTLTRWIGVIMRPRLVKNCETSWPASASRAMSSADVCGGRLAVVLVEGFFGFGGFPERDEVVVLAFIVFTYFENQGVEPSADPADRAVLFGEIGALIEIVRALENRLSFLEPDCPLWVPLQFEALLRVKTKPHLVI